jgi:hypothetical protein
MRRGAGRAPPARLLAGYLTVCGWEGNMAHALILKTISVGLENWAKDCVQLGEFLELRVKAHQALGLKPPIPVGTPPFKETPYVDPKPGTYGKVAGTDRAQLLSQAADMLDSVASLNQDTLADPQIFGGQPAAPAMLAAQTSEDDLLRLIVNWQALASHFFKVALKMYGLEPQPHPVVRHPGAGSEERHLATILAWLTKIQADAVSFQRAQNITPGGGYHTNPGTGSFGDSLLRVEQAYHKVALDVAQIATFLPNHLLRAQI